MSIIDKMYQYQVLKPMTDQMIKDIENSMDINIECTESDFHGYDFKKIENGIVYFSGYYKYSCGSDYMEFEMPIEEFMEIMTNKKELNNDK